MKIDIKHQGSEFSLTIDEGNFIEVDGQKAVRQQTLKDLIVGSDGVEKVLESIGDDQYFTHFEYDQYGLDGSTCRKLAAAYVEGGLDGLHEKFDTYTLERSPYEYYENVGAKQDVSSFIDEIIEQLKEQLEEKGVTAVLSGIDDDESLKEELQDSFKESVIEYMRQSDESDFTDAISPHDKVEVSFIPGYADLAVDDLFTAHHDNCFDPTTAYPDGNLMRILSFLNIAPSEFVKDVKEAYEIDLTEPQIEESYSEYRIKDEEQKAHLWRAILGVEAGRNDEVASLQLNGDYEIRRWNDTVDAFKDKKDYDRPRVFERDGLITVMANASYGGVGAWVARLPLKDLLDGKFDEPFLARGGQVGIHDYINGSGYIEGPENPVLIDLSQGAFRAGRDERKDEVDDVYGFVASALEPKIEEYKKPDWHRAGPGRWIRQHENVTAEIVSASGRPSKGPYAAMFKDQDGELLDDQTESYETLEEAFARTKDIMEFGDLSSGLKM